MVGNRTGNSAVNIGREDQADFNIETGGNMDKNFDMSDFNNEHGHNDQVEDDNYGGKSAMLTAQWPKVAAKLRAELGEDLFSSWFARMEAEDLTGKCLTVSVPTKFLKSWVETHYFQVLLRTCKSVFPQVEEITLQIRTRGLPRKQSHVKQNDFNQRPDKSEPLTVSGAAPVRVNGFSLDGLHGSRLDDNLTFETFISGKSNALAHAAAMRVADASPSAPLSFNPLYIHSVSGLGKTHLLNAIASRIRARHPGRKVQYITAERFMYHFINALKKKDVIPFKDFFNSIDVLLIDDFQFLQGKTMQQEFCHTFNSLVDNKRQVVVAADVPPSQLGSIDQRMRSRFAGGLVVDITSPELELRREILYARLARAQAKDRHLHIGDDVIEYIANRINSGGRELEGALNRVIASQQLTRAKVSIDMAVVALRDLADCSEPVRIRIDDILKIIGNHYAVSRTDLLSPRRARSIVRPRQVGMYLAKKLTSRSLPEIGRRFGGRDHSTVLHAVRKIETLMGEDDHLAREVELLLRLVEQR